MRLMRHRLTEKLFMLYTPKLPKRKKVDRVQENLFNACTDALKENTTNRAEEMDEYDHLGSYIAKKFKKIQNAEQRILAEGLLMQVMQKATLGKLSENTILGEAVLTSMPTPSFYQDFSG